MSRLMVLTASLCLFACPPEPGPPLSPCTLTATELDTINSPGHSVARVWNELELHAIRKDLPMPTVHARNLFHVSAAMYDAWAAYDPIARGVFTNDKFTAADVAAARREAISYAAYRVLWHRYRTSAAGGEMGQCFNDTLKDLGYDPTNTTTKGSSPAALGNRIAASIIAFGATDGANEDAGYADTTGFVAQNAPLVVAQPGNAMREPDHWQPLQLSQGFSQNGINTGNGPQPYMGAHWGQVTPFAMTRTGTLYHQPEPAPATSNPHLRRWLVEVLRKQADFAVGSGTIDLSPGALGNNPVGTNDGHGRALNPVTGKPYAPNVVPLRDFGRVLAEFWADGPRSETPPGHWNVIANSVSDSPGFARAFRGDSSQTLDPLEWDVKVYLALNGALHDAAITAWEIKRASTTSRPISLLRWYASNHGQSSDAGAPSYDPEGLPLVPDLLELVTAQTASPGERHQGLNIGSLVARSWVGERTSFDTASIGWRQLSEWLPYQRSTFVTPAFPAYISGHSTFSRAGAEVLAELTGSEYFPGGLGTYVAAQNRGLTFETGPSVQVELQWATYFDAADQAGQSRLWGGIHIEPDDFNGRRLGQLVGREALARALRLFEGQP